MSKPLEFEPARSADEPQSALQTLTPEAARHLGKLLFAYACGLSEELAADLVQEALLSLHQKSGQELRKQASLYAYCRRVIFTRYIDHLRHARRQQAREPGVLDTLDVSGRWSVLDLARSLHQQRALAAILDMFSGHGRQSVEAFLLRHIHELSYSSLAEHYQVSYDTIRKRVSRAKELIRLHLVERGFGRRSGE